MTAKPPIVCIMGATATGKTALAIALCQMFPMDIISVDSALVYRGMDIGTAKPSPTELAQAPHRLINIRDPWHTYSAADFCQDALAEIKAIQQQHRIPLLVGGTMLYFRALLQGLDPLPSASPELRTRLETLRKQIGNQAFHQRLADVDPVAAARIHHNDQQRVQRALEVHELTGSTLTELQSQNTVKELPFDAHKLVLMPPDRAWIHQRIAQRFELMLAQGFIEEVKCLKANPALHIETPAMRSVGYRQVWRYLDAAIDYPTLVSQGISATRQFAKRQLTWLRSETDTTAFDCNAANLQQSVKEYLDKKLLIPPKAHIL